MSVTTDVKLSIWLSEEEIILLSFLISEFIDGKRNDQHVLMPVMISCSQELGVAHARESSSALRYKSLSKALGKADSVPVKFSSYESTCLARELNLPISLREKLLY